MKWKFLYLGKIAAGTPVEAIQNEVSRIPLPSNLRKKWVNILD